MAVISISISFQFHYGNMEPLEERLQSEEHLLGDETGEMRKK